ncbi:MULTISPECIES: hypothetical protein [Enterobacterales]|uniref:hypothetical protein n=1 Tax=Enterobacterales TaxID=91347 RepID=UPI00210C38F4|nr:MULTISPECIES: hypothetical protein [Enterobacteriaceae]MCQ3844876.1 hypothetical protein [Klebsiella pneumoniae]MDM2972136.1 hypothetical protein [Citrobacter sp. CK198]
MSKNNNNLAVRKIMSEWFTIKEAIQVAKRMAKTELTEGDIYRYALSKHIYLSIYFQSPVLLRKIKEVNHKLKMRPSGDSLIQQLCMLESNSFSKRRNLMISTKGKYFFSPQRVIDTDLSGHEYVLVQRLLALSLRLPLPVTGANENNFGITVYIDGESFQIFEKTTWHKRIGHQLSLLSEPLAQDIIEKISGYKNQQYHRAGYFPLYTLPTDACFVIRHSELDKLIGLYRRSSSASSTVTRMSTPLSRLFWLACKHNEAISPLIRHPYKLLSIFEQWASDDGITDHLSGDTLKNALERGSPSSASLPH